MLWGNHVEEDVIDLDFNWDPYDEYLNNEPQHFINELFFINEFYFLVNSNKYEYGASSYFYHVSIK